MDNADVSVSWRDQFFAIHIIWFLLRGANQRLESPVTGLVIQTFIQTNIKENIKAHPDLVIWPLCPGDWWITLTKGQ